MFTGVIEGVGPRYCPSVEDKVHRFADKTSHQIFIEPEGLTTHEIYPNGISTRLPFDVQLALVRSIRGFEHAHITRPGYAIEYDYFDPRDLQGLARDQVRRRPVLRRPDQRHDRLRGSRRARLSRRASTPRCACRTRCLVAAARRGLLGVLVDDLITRGTSEPYRMFTSRAEYRLLLREDNADLRLTPIGRELGLVDDARWAFFDAQARAHVKRKRRAWNARSCVPAIVGREARALGARAVRARRMRSTCCADPRFATARSLHRGCRATGLDAAPGADERRSSRFRCRSTCRPSTPATSSGSATKSSGSATTKSAPAGRSRLCAGARPVDRSAPAAARGAPADPRPGGTHSRRDAGGGLVAAGPPQAPFRYSLTARRVSPLKLKARAACRRAGCDRAHRFPQIRAGTLRVVASTGFPEHP